MWNTPLSFSLSQKTAFLTQYCDFMCYFVQNWNFCSMTSMKVDLPAPSFRSVACKQLSSQDLYHEAHAHIQYWVAAMFIYNNKTSSQGADNTWLTHLWMPRHVCNGLIICSIISQWYKARYDGIIGGLMDFSDTKRILSFFIYCDSSEIFSQWIS